MEAVLDFIFLGSKISAVMKLKDTCSMKGKTVKTLDSILKGRDVTLSAKVHIVSYGFLVVMYGCERLTIKKAECRRIDVFELWGWRKLLRVPWRARRSNQLILKEINFE